jgi:hypothetical protein
LGQALKLEMGAWFVAKGYPREPAYAIGDVLDWTYSGNRLDPTQKPLPVLLPLVETFSPYGGLVLDPFAALARRCWRPGCSAADFSASSSTATIMPSQSAASSARARRAAVARYLPHAAPSTISEP